MEYIDLSYEPVYKIIEQDPRHAKSSQDIYSQDKELIEGFGNFGRVNLELCCPLGYYWSELQKKCVKICDGCSTSSYGQIQYEFLHNHGNEFMSFTVCEGDASKSYNIPGINKRYNMFELLDQYDFNIDVDDIPAPPEENQWKPVLSGGGSGQKVEDMGTYAAEAKEAYLQHINDNDNIVNDNVVNDNINVDENNIDENNIVNDNVVNDNINR